jgi:hypothetical protein
MTILRRLFIGVLAGGAASSILVATLGQPVLSVLLGATIGIAYAAGLYPSAARTSIT